MNQDEKRIYLIKELLKEQTEYRNISIPEEKAEQKQLLRGLMNIRRPHPASAEFLKIQDEYLQEAIFQKGIVELNDIPVVGDGIYLWQGDITTLRCDAIVNAANSGMTGCYAPCHGCIDNAIHTYAGIQLRLECAKMMAEQGHSEPTGQAKLTRAYNLPCNYILHTVGPIVQSRPTAEDDKLLADCYRSCLELAEKNGIKSIAFCCISTGEFHFPNDMAAEIAVKAVKGFKANSGIEVIFNVFKDLDLKIYRKLLG